MENVNKQTNEKQQKQHQIIKMNIVKNNYIQLTFGFA